jgi:hypothetical protein
MILMIASKMLTIWKKLKKVKSMLFEKGRFRAKNSLKCDFFPPKLTGNPFFM